MQRIGGDGRSHGLCIDGNNRSSRVPALSEPRVKSEVRMQGSRHHAERYARNISRLESRRWIGMHVKSIGTCQKLN